MGQGIVWLMVIAGWIAFSNASPKTTVFEKIADGAENDWDAKGNGHLWWLPNGALYGDNKIWLFTRHQYEVRPGRYTMKPGGFVSTLNLTDKTWTHQPYTTDAVGTPFFLNGRLFSFQYFKLYSWNDTEWTEIPFDTSAEQNPRGSNIEFVITVPDPSSNIVYLASSATDWHVQGSIPENSARSQATVCKLEITFDVGSKPINASLTLFDTFKYGGPFFVQSTPALADRLYVFYTDMGHTDQINNEAYLWNLPIKTEETKTVEFTMADSSVDPNVIIDRQVQNNFQFRDKVLFFGRINASFIVTQEEYIESPKMWSYDLKTSQLDDVELQYPIVWDPTIALDRVNGVIYAIDVKKGVYMSKLEV